MTLITFDCPQCHKVMKSARPIVAGSAIRCPSCGSTFTPPATSASEDFNASAVIEPRRSRRAWIALLAILILLGLGIGGYYWWRERNANAKPHDPLAYVPPDSEIVAGIDAAVLLDDPLLGPDIQAGIRSLIGGDLLERCAKETGLSTNELLGHALMAGKLRLAGSAIKPDLLSTQTAQIVTAPTLILQTTKPIDREKLARALPSAKRQTAHEQTYFDLHEGQWQTLFMPSDRIIVLSSRPASELEALFTSDGTTASFSGDAYTLVRAVESHSLWAVVPVEGQVRTDLQDLVRNGKGNADSLESALANSKGLAIWGSTDGTNLTFGAHVLCTDVPAAQFMSAGIEQAWKQQKAELDRLGALLMVMPKTNKVFQSLKDGVRFTKDGPIVGVTTSVSRQALEESQKEVAEHQDLLGLMGKLPGLSPKNANPGGKKR